MSGRPHTQAIAVVGIGCRFPGGANDPGTFWDLLADGVDAVREVPQDRFDVERFYHPDPATPGAISSRYGGFVDDIDRFDAAFFGIAPREARRIDPQQRLLLEVAWEALEDGGQSPDTLAGSDTGVFVGIAAHDYLDIQALASNRETIDAHVNAGSAGSIAANRISYVLDARGPSLAVDTACSSSLTAVHLAVRSLRSGECDLAIVGGAGALLAPEVTIGFSKASMLSPDGRCRAFDAGANGYVRSEGAGAVVLKPLERAIADGDPVRAVILGSAANQDGRTTGISVPSERAQTAMIRRALREADVDPAEVGYVEAHGTGTAVGDPIEARAIGAALGAGRAADDHCLVGSVKTNIGHLEAASGIAGLIKAALVVERGAIPANLHFDEPNPAIAFDELRLRVPTRLEAWPAHAARAVAGVNSFGFGGANAHVVLAAPPEPARTDARRASEQRPTHAAVHVLPLSARDPQALRELAGRHARWLERERATPLSAHCATAAVRRSHHAERLAVVADTREAMIERLATFEAGDTPEGIAVGSATSRADAKLAFVFTGMGPQWWGMGRGLLEHERAYRETLERVDGVLEPIAGWSLLAALGEDEGSSRVREAWLAHVANFALQVALADMWRSKGITPDAVVGHSSGAMAAACVAGAVSFEDGVRLAYHRGRLQHRTAGQGRMLAVALTPEEAQHLIAGHEERVSLAAINAPGSVTLSGAGEVLATIADTLEREGRFARFLQVDVPYHAPQMEPLRDEFTAAVADLTSSAPDIPLVLDVTGDWADGRPLDAAYWWRGVREPVRFADAVGRLLDAGCDHVVEVGPHPVLAPAIAACAAERGRAPTIVPSLRRDDDDRTVVLRSLATLYAHGRELAWRSIVDDAPCVPLPSYPWQRERHWFDAGGDAKAPQRRPTGTETGHPLLGRRLSSPRPTWETTLDDPRAAFLDDHVVQDATVFPGAAYVEMMLAAAASEHGDVPVALEDVAFEALLFLRRPRVDPVQVHLDPRDRTIAVHAATNRDEHGWTVHATGRMQVAADEPTPRIDLDACRERCATVLAAEDHYAAFEQRAYRFGRTFHTLESIAFGDGEAVARVGFPADVELDVEPFRVHPALLDAALQLFGAARIGSAASPRDDVPFFPVSIRRLVLHRTPERRFWIHAVVHHPDDPTRWTGDAWLVDEHGDVCIAMEGVRLQALDDAAPQRAVEDDLYELVWERADLEGGATSGPITPYPLRSPNDVRTAVEAERGPPERTPELATYFATVEPALNRVAAEYAAIALASLGWTPAAGASPDTAAGLGVVARHRRLFGSLARTCMQHERPPRDRSEVRRELDALRDDHPMIGAEIELVRRGGDRLAEILSGDLDARELLLDGASLELLARVYHDSPTSRGFHEILGDAVDAALDRDRADRPLRVLEIGAGTGAATAALLPRLPAGSEYVFTDVSPYFLTQARERFADGPELRFEVFDIERDPVEQGVEPGGFDLVVGVNVVHTTRSLRNSLAHVHRSLAPGGMLVLQELTRKSPWYDLVFGLLDGWWRFDDGDLRPDHPLLLPREWRALLADNGFDEATTLHQGDDEDAHVQTVILGRAAASGASTTAAGAPAEVPDAAGDARQWLVLGDGAGVGARLAQVLHGRGDLVTLAYPAAAYRRHDDGSVDLPTSDAEALRSALVNVAEGAGAGGRIDGIVHAWSLDAPAVDDLDAARLVDAQVEACGGALTLLQALGGQGDDRPDVWFVTAGAQAVPGADDAPNVVQSALWGLGRVAVSERAAGGCRLVDLGAAPSDDEIVALAAAIRAGGDDEEMALRGDARFVRRVERVTLRDRIVAEPVVSMSPERDAFRLEIDRPGALDSLVLREAPTREPGPGEIALRVLASGLNFRDVLRTVGVLPAVAFQHDPDPDGMGIECAGVVLACGEGVDAFEPGDEVIAFAGATHGSRAIAVADLTVAKPPNVTFTQAASILNAFVTVEYALGHLARLDAGERLLVHSATGAVGLAAIDHARRIGATVFATAGNEAKRDHLRSLGVEHVMDSRSLAWADEVLERTGGEGVDVVLNALAGEAVGKGLSVLRRHGRFVELGKRDILEDARLGLAPFERNLSFHAVDLVQLALDRPGLAQRLVRTVVDDVAVGARSLVPCTAFDLADAERAFRLMAQAQHVGKVVLTVEGERYDVRSHRAAGLCRSDATYLISGGLGGLGLAVAEWLVRVEGARHVVLMSRSDTPKDGPGALAALEAAGAEVIVETGDVSSEDDVRRVLERIDRDLPPLRGVFHAAMVLDDDALVDLDRARFRTVLDPKAAGAWNLHRATIGRPLDLFVLFSSIASVVGHPLQGNYAAANAFLDALAAHRRGLGLPAHAIGWGAIAGAGYVSRHPEIARHLRRSGLTPSSLDDALESLGTILRHDVPHTIAARIEWQTWARLNTFAAASRRFQSLLSPDGAAGTDESTTASPLAALRAATPSDRHELLATHLRTAIARVLGTTAEKVPPERPLTEIGIDSLMAVELVTGLQTDLGVRVPVVKILEGTTAHDLADVLIDALQLATERGEAVTDTVSEPVSEPDAEPAAEWTSEPARAPIAAPAATPRSGYPLSAEQRRFWFLHHLEPENAAHHVFAAARLRGRLDVAALRRSLDELVQRHAVLRTRFGAVDGEPWQVPQPAVPARLEQHDVTNVSAAQRDDALRRIATSAIREPFDLERPPLLRAVVVRRDEDDHAFVLIVHHIAAEAWTMTQLVREIMAMYEASASGAPAPLAPMSDTADYEAYVRHQAAVSETTRVRSQLAYWRERLAGAPTHVPLPPDRPRPARPRFRGRRHRFTLSRELSQALRALGRSEGATLFATVLAAYQTLLHRSSGETDLCIGTPVITRDARGLETVVGCCMNTLVLRSDLGGDPSFRDVLRGAKRTALDAFAHQDVPFDEVVSALRPERGARHAPLFRTMLIVHTAPLPALALPGVRVEPLDVDAEAAVTDLTLFVEPGETIHGAFEYDVDLFEERTIARLAERFETLLRGVVERPDAPLSHVPSFLAGERRLVTETWNDTDVPHGDVVQLGDLVDDQARRTPGATAITGPDGDMTYGAVAERTNRLAHHLVDLGVAPGTSIGVALPPSTEAVIAAIAVVKAGGVYLPLDPHDPTERVRMVVEDAGAGLVLTSAPHLDGGSLAARVVDLGEAQPAIARCPATRPTPSIGPDDPAYAIYTSGSTGAPKGVAVPHRAIVNQVSWRQRAFSLTSDDAVLLHTPLTFDPSVWEIFGPLAAGARLVVPTEADRRDGAGLVTTIQRQAVSVLQTVPSLLTALLDEPSIGRCRTLRLVACGGEAVTTALRDRLSAHLDADLHVLYGVSEAAIDATHWVCPQEDRREVLPIGRPIDNVRVYVLDDALEPVPVGVPGELYVAGAGVALGYVGRPAETEATFVVDPFTPDGAARMVRTGDRARWLPDGTLAFMGRVDDQLKVRGHRVEPVEVESILERDPDVRRAAVVVSDERGSVAPHGRLEGHRVVAYVTPSGERSPDTAALVRRTREALPSYMVPASIVVLDELPSTAGGKLDRRSLAARVGSSSDVARDVAPPGDTIEHRLVALWEELFDERPIGVDDDFFALGGHSLLAMRLCARIRAAFEVDLPVAALVEHPTIAALARRFRAQHATATPLVTITSSGPGRPFYFVHPLGGGVMRYVDLAGALRDERPFHALDAHGLASGRAPDASVEAMAARYVDAVRDVQPEGPYTLGGWSMGGVVAFEMARRLEAAGAPVALLALVDAESAFTAGGPTPDERGSTAPDGALPSLAAFERMAPEEQLALALRHAGVTEGAPGAAADTDHLRRHLAVFRAHLEALRRYTPQPYGGRVTLLDAARRGGSGGANGAPAWDALAVGGVERCSVPGDHHSMLRAPHVRHLARALEDRLRRAERFGA